MVSNKDVSDYLESKHTLWRRESVQAAASRLMHYHPEQDVAKVYSDMAKAGYKPYYIKITFVTISAFMDWLIAQGRATLKANTYKEFMRSNNQLFRNAYQDKYSTATWQDFQTEYANANKEMRLVLALIGFGGCRLSEIYTFDGTGVMGKGSKRRHIHLPKEVEFVPITLTKDQIRRRLKHKPHDYRKLAADTWFRNGFDIKTVQVLLGHTSLTSTQRYLRPMEKDAMKDQLEAMWRSA